MLPSAPSRAAVNLPYKKRGQRNLFEPVVVVVVAVVVVVVVVVAVVVFVVFVVVVVVGGADDGIRRSCLPMKRRCMHRIGVAELLGV